MKSESRGPSGRFALSGIAAASLCLFLPGAWALGLGKLAVQSALGENLRAEIDISSLTPDEAANLKVRVASPEAYKAAGVDYNAVLPTAQVVLQRRADGRPYLRIVSDRAVQEPFVDVILELTWNTGRLVREYTLLIDPPTTRTAAAPEAATPPVVAAPAPAAKPPVAVAAAPSATAAPATPSPAPARTAPEPRPVAPEPKAAAPAKAAPAAPAAKPAAPAVAAAPAPQERSAGENYRVKPGDTLSGIARSSQPQGVSLDQMLVALFRGNADAFVGNNMNRLKAGAVLQLPDAEAAKATSAGEARQFVQAQSADFQAYRQRLASGVAPAEAAQPASRQASGKVEAAVEDRKQAAAATPDKLTLSKAEPGAKASAPEDKLSKQREAKDAAARTAELQRNVAELKGLAEAAKAPASVPAVAAAPAAVAASASVGIAAAPPPAPAASVVAAAPTASAVAAAPAASAVAAGPAASVVAAAAPAASVAAAAPAVEEPGMMASLMEDPVALGGGGLVLALLAGYGALRYARSRRTQASESSFLESRLQPDSFFGVSGGQRIDTRDEAPSGTPSSMSYSLSQLDAIGDVDPVAEADVYLAYGRDLQAEEILKEAMRATPERLAIRSKLLEVYAKRRDAKGFEALALQLYDLTRGEGDEWARAQELGQQIDPDNPLYQPGGHPEQLAGDGERPAEPLGASTMPQSVLPSPSQFERMVAGTAVLPSAADAALDLHLDLDLDQPATAPARPTPPPEDTQPIAPAAVDERLSLDLPIDAAPPPAAAPAARDLSLDFDLGGISLDLDRPATAAAGDVLELPEVDGDAFERKLELAEEFRQIGDLEGARDLLEEVIAQTGGAIQAKARNMLERLA